MFKRITILLICFLLMSSSFSCFVYADDTVGEEMTEEQYNMALISYLSSRGGSLISDGAGNTSYINGLVKNYMESSVNNTGIIDESQLKGLMRWSAHSVNQGSELMLTIGKQGIDFLNSFTDWALSKNYFGSNVTLDSNGLFNLGSDNTVYTGKEVSGAQCYIFGNTIKPAIYNSVVASAIQHQGTVWQYSGLTLKSMYDSGTTTAHLVVPNDSYDLAINYDSSNRYWGYYRTYRNLYTYYYSDGRSDYSSNRYLRANVCLGYAPAQDAYYLMLASYRAGDFQGVYTLKQISLPSAEVKSLDVGFYSNDNNGVSNYPSVSDGESMYITPKYKDGDTYKTYKINQGDTIENVVNNYYIDSNTKDKTISTPSNEPPASPTPGGNLPGWDISGGQGNYDPDTHTITFPDFNLPDLNIDWSIDGLGNKFPFSIPFDIAALVSVLNAPPEAPRFQGTVNFGFTTWDYDINLEQFDSVAQACRIAELLLLVFGLILITRSIIKG